MFKAIYELFTGRSFEFYTQYPLDDCKAILESASVRQPNENPADGSTLLVNTSVIDETRIAFLMYESDVKLGGIIQEMDAGVLVSGKINIRFHKEVFLFLILPWSCSSFFNLVGGLLIAIVIFLTVSIVFMLMILPGEFNRMDERLHYLLGKSKKKNPEGEL